MDRQEAMRRLAEGRVARLATADASGVPHVVPFTYALDGETVYWAVDHKPKRSSAIKRLENIRANPNVEMVVDRYAERWETLWWVRASGRARVVEEQAEREGALSLLASKYPQYRARPPEGPAVAIVIARVTWWEG
jgi:PPOX class probable F420-dependent enzyme